MIKIEKNFCAFCLARNYAFIMLVAFFACFLGACSSENEFDAMGMFEADEIVAKSSNLEQMRDKILL